MSFDRQHWNGDMKSLLQPLADVVKENKRFPIARPMKINMRSFHSYVDSSFVFAKLSENDQRDAIKEHIKIVPFDASLIFEALGEHGSSPAFLAAFFSHDTAEMGKIADRMIREYMGKFVQESIEREPKP